MIIDKLKNADNYAKLGRRFAKAFEFLRNNGLANMEEGRYEIEGNKLYALVQHYYTRSSEKCIWEAHRKYIDIQYIAEGAERMGYACVDDLQVTTEYVRDEDYLLLKGDGDTFLARAGTFVIFTPADAHMPCIAVTVPRPVKKIVVKVQA
jgi:YhcH/YjgK/YiaL family protein